MRVLFVIRTRWLVVGTIAIVGAIGAIVYHDETDRSEAALDELGDREAEVARAAARGDLASLEEPGTTRVLSGRSGALAFLDGTPVPRDIADGCAVFRRREADDRDPASLRAVGARPAERAQDAHGRSARCRP